MTRYVDINNRRGRLNRDRAVEQGWDSIYQVYRAHGAITGKNQHAITGLVIYAKPFLPLMELNH